MSDRTMRYQGVVRYQRGGAETTRVIFHSSGGNFQFEGSGEISLTRRVPIKVANTLRHSILWQVG